MHDAFINIMEQAHRFDPARGSVRAWLVGCVRFRVLDRLRESADVVDEVMREVVSEVVSEVIEEVAEQDLAAAIDLRRSTTALHAAISELPLIFREVLVLCELEEMSYADVARLLDCPIGTVRSRLARARQHLVSKLLIPAAAVRCFETPVAPEAAR